MGLTSISNKKEKAVNGLKQIDVEKIKSFLQGAVYCWCNNNQDTGFTLRDLMGKGNRNWSNTPLQAIYLKHRNEGKTNKGAFDQSSKDAGNLLLSVLLNENKLNGIEFLYEKEWKSIRYYLKSSS